METTLIRHVVIVPANISNEEVSLFQGFSLRLITEYKWIFHSLSYFPYDVLEIFLSTEKRVLSKIIGGLLDIDVIREDLIVNYPIKLDRYFTVLWSTESTYETAEKISHDFKHKPIHITSIEKENSQFIEDLDEDKINNLLLDVITSVIEKEPSNPMLEILTKYIKSGTHHTPKKDLEFKPLSHNCTIPLIKALQSYGYNVDNMRKGNPLKGNEDYIDGIMELYNLVDKIRGNVDLKGISSINDILIYNPSMYSYLYNTKNKQWKDINRNLTKDERVFLRKVLIRNNGYSNIAIKINNKNFNPQRSKSLSPLISMRQLETELFSHIMAILSTSQFLPAIRFPNSVMLHHDKLDVIHSLVSSSNNKNKINKVFYEYSESIKNNIGKKLLEKSIIKKNKIIMVCDYPLEWISINHTPIMFTHEISRVPSTPGGNLVNMTLSVKRELLPYSLIKKVLILSSFEKDDPIKEHLSHAIKVFSKNDSYTNLSITHTQVKNEDELLTALNHFDGAIVVFDCHGNHGGKYEHAWLNIGKDKVNTWELAYKCRIPPIIILSACSTHSIDGSHASVANGFFRSGAKSVIGTYAPIKADHAALFIARFLLRLSQFLPIIIKNRVLNWREVVSGFLKMSYATDILHGLKKLNKINNDQLTIIHGESNKLINFYVPDWNNKFRESIINNSNLEIGELNTLIKTNFQFVDTMLYTQLGRPENILIFNDME